MTTALPYTRTPNPQPATPERVAEVLAEPGFGQHFTDHMVTIRWNREQGWHDARVEPYHSLELDPAAMVLHYGQAIFEGLKAYRRPDGTIASFRPQANAERFRASARRLAMPELPDELFLGSIRELLAVDSRWVPTVAEDSLYLRPFLYATEKGLGVRPATEYLYVLIASPAGSYFAGGLKPVTVWLSTEYVRAAPGGTGAAKFAGNYAASLVAQAQAAEQGCDQVVWLDAVERRWVEEMGGMNLFFVLGSGPDARVVTPELSGALLPGITRNSLLRLAADFGYGVEERRFSTEEWEKKAESGELTEVFACGTAAVITPVGHVKHADGEFSVSGGATGEVTLRLRERLTGIQQGLVEDSHGWMTELT
ncbi:branched-chain amino acid aminotransferase [Saccharothrix tamanrassetensis]|uniref:Branched-chain-amino-acid aminotransferase n=1 Tax=Saccharothrix tamanrassetensis TaxID=1051531 RepID=A0A841CV83_9PSEU|nr:branched-chain amino acid aminotransferase [Saccharothrix tamanrassetensis]MBB5959865.1 branched-chain amino acid aminotransferase [Saccharothrix tamanrassetensis]